MSTRHTFFGNTAITLCVVIAVSAVVVSAYSQGSAKATCSPCPRASSSSDDNGKPVNLPDNVVKYSQVPKQGKVFTAASIPKGLLKDHTTKKGTWGLICVSQGTLEYTIQEPAPRVLQLVAPATGVIEPQCLHHVKALTENVEFVVEFYRKPGTGPVDEKREGL